MPTKLGSDVYREYRDLANAARRIAETATDLTTKSEFQQIEHRWLTLARDQLQRDRQDHTEISPVEEIGAGLEFNQPKKQSPALRVRGSADRHCRIRGVRAFNAPSAAAFGGVKKIAVPRRRTALVELQSLFRGRCGGQHERHCLRSSGRRHQGDPGCAPGARRSCAGGRSSSGMLMPGTSGQPRRPPPCNSASTRSSASGWRCGERARLR